jgi:hypothetical protein
VLRIRKSIALRNSLLDVFGIASPSVFLKLISLPGAAFKRSENVVDPFHSSYALEIIGSTIGNSRRRFTKLHDVFFSLVQSPRVWHYAGTDVFDNTIGSRRRHYSRETLEDEARKDALFPGSNDLRTIQLKQATFYRCS